MNQSKRLSNPLLPYIIIGGIIGVVLALVGVFNVEYIVSALPKILAFLSTTTNNLLILPFLFSVPLLIISIILYISFSIKR